MKVYVMKNWVTISEKDSKTFLKSFQILFRNVTLLGRRKSHNRYNLICNSIRDVTKDQQKFRRNDLNNLLTGV